MVVSANLIKSDAEGVRMSRAFEDMLNELPEGKYRVIIEHQTERHSLPQRRLLFMWFSYLSRRTGESKKKIYKYYCDKFLTEDMPSVSEMSNYQLTHFMHEIEADVATELGIPLPTPEDGIGYIHFIKEYKDK